MIPRPLPFLLCLWLLLPILFAADEGRVAPFRSLEKKIHGLVNDHRKKVNRIPLRLDENLSEIAREHSWNMASEKVPLSHDGFDERADRMLKIIAYRTVAENVAVNLGHKDPAAQAMKTWLASMGHRKNIEEYFDSTGIGVARSRDGKYYFTQLFLLSRDSPPIEPWH